MGRLLLLVKILIKTNCQPFPGRNIHLAIVKPITSLNCHDLKTEKEAHTYTSQRVNDKAKDKMAEEAVYIYIP